MNKDTPYNEQEFLSSLKDSVSIVGAESNLFATINGWIKKYTRRNALTEQDIVKSIDDPLANLESFVSCYEKFLDPKDINAFMTTLKQRVGKENPVMAVYLALAQNYTGSTKTAESLSQLSQLYLANKNLIKILKELRANVADILNNDVLSLDNCTVTSAAALGLIRQADILSEFSCILWTELINLYTETPVSTLKYKLVFLNDNLKLVAAMVNDLTQKKARYSFTRAVHEVRRQNNDALLQSEDVSYNKYVSDNKLVPLIIGIGVTFTTISFLGIFRLNPIKLIAERLDRWHYDRYLKRKDLHEWMVGYTALLRYDLESKDPSSPEYQRLRKVIAAYDEKIAKYVRKIKEYEDE